MKMSNKMHNQAIKRVMERFKQFLSALTTVIYFGLVSVAGILLIAFIAFGIWMPSCDEDSEAVQLAKAISQERLSKLYLDMERYSEMEDIAPFGYSEGSEKAAIPNEFVDLTPAKVRPIDGNIMLEGCFDHYVYLRFNGIGFTKELYDAKEIILSWGEGPNAGSVKLWPNK